MVAHDERNPPDPPDRVARGWGNFVAAVVVGSQVEDLGEVEEECSLAAGIACVVDTGSRLVGWNWENKVLGLVMKRWVFGRGRPSDCRDRLEVVPRRGGTGLGLWHLDDCHWVMMCIVGSLDRVPRTAVTVC